MRRPRGMGGVACAALGLACISAGITVTPPPEIKDPPIPDAFEGAADPALVPTDGAGLLHAPEVDDHLYFYEPDVLWYRYKYNRWYQAFAWNGNWFVPERIPEVLVGREPLRSWPGLMPLDPNIPVDEEGLPDPNGIRPIDRQN